jgi:hypothetical protein
MTVYYDNRFNQNEWFIIVLIIIMYTIVFLLPKRFPVLISAIFLLYGIFIGFLLDKSISEPPFDYYDVNDNSLFELFDFLSYIMYGPFSYLIAYFFDRFKLKKQHILFYLVLWSSIAFLFEWIGIKFGVYHYEKGWRLEFSFPSYLAINSILLTLYYKLCRKKEQ